MLHDTIFIFKNVLKIYKIQNFTHFCKISLPVTVVLKNKQKSTHKNRIGKRYLLTSLCVPYLSKCT